MAAAPEGERCPEGAFCGTGALGSPRYYCVRLARSTTHITQLCDPNDAKGATTGAVGDAVSGARLEPTTSHPPHHLV